LDIVVDLHALFTPLPFEDALGNGGDDGIVAALDAFEGFGKFCVVGGEFGGPFLAVVGGGVVAAGGGRAFDFADDFAFVGVVAVGGAVAVAVGLWDRFVLPAFYAGVLCGFAEEVGTFFTVPSCRAEEPFFYFGGELWAGEFDKVLVRV
jgi:hypothetical protein